MNEEISNLFDRQLGLVYQERIEDIRILITGHGPTIGFLIQELVFLGFGSSQGFIAFPDDIKVRLIDIKGQLFFKESDIGKNMWEVVKFRVGLNYDPNISILGIESLDDYNYDSVIVVETASDNESNDYRIPSYENGIYAITTKTGTVISSKKLDYNKCNYNVLQPSLSAICAGLVATEIMRRNFLLRVSEILDTNLQIRYVLQQKGILKECRESQRQHKGLPLKIRMKIGGENVPVTFEPFTETQIIYGPEGRLEKKIEDPDRIIIYASLPKKSFLKRFFVEQMEVLETYQPGHFKPIDDLLVSPFQETRICETKIIDANVSIPEYIRNKKVYFLGVGGLGSWTTLLFNVSNTEYCTLVLNDHDTEVEEHNLNRQILFDRTSIGKPKVEAAESTLRKTNPKNKIVKLPFELDIGVVNCLINEDFMSMDEYAKQKALNSNMIEGLPLNFVREEPVIANELKTSDIFVCGPDNIRVRYVSSLIGKLLGITVVNAGAERFEGKVDLFEPNGDCYICRYGEESKFKQEVVSCTGRIPIPSIVTTISIIGSIQSLMAILKLVLPEEKSLHYLQYYGRYQLIASCFGNPCRHKKSDACPGHLNLPIELNPFQFFN